VLKFTFKLLLKILYAGSARLSLVYLQPMQFTLKMCAAAVHVITISKQNHYNLLFQKIQLQGRSRSSTLVSPKSSSACSVFTRATVGHIAVARLRHRNRPSVMCACGSVTKKAKITRSSLSAARKKFQDP